MSGLHPEHRTYVIGAFAAALRQREFSRPNEKSLVASTVQEAVAKLGEIFRSNVGFNPTHGPGTHCLHPLLTRQNTLFRTRVSAVPPQLSYHVDFILLIVNIGHLSPHNQTNIFIPFA